MSDDATYARTLGRMGELTAPVARRAIDSLPIVPGATVLDAGCGVGRHVRYLLERVGREGRVVGLDRSPGNLQIARTGYPATDTTVSWIQGDLSRMPFENRSFDLVWCSDTLWPGFVSDPVAVVKELARVTKPGGFVALSYWVDQALLGCHPRLENRLRASFAEQVPYLTVPPEQQVANARMWLSHAHLEPVRSEALVRSLHGPLDEEARSLIHDAIDMLYQEASLSLTTDEHDLYRCVALPGQSTSVTSNPAYFGWIVYALHIGRVPTQSSSTMPS